MDEQSKTVGEAVDFEASFGEKLRAELREKLAAVRAAVSGPVFDAAVDKVVEKAAEVLDSPIADLLTAAWGRYPEIQELCRQGPGDEAMAELCEHSFDWKYEPKIEVVVNQIPISIPLGVGVELAVAGGVLVVAGGRMKELRAGKVAAKVGVDVAGKALEPVKKEVELPRVLRFAEPAAAREAVAVPKIVTAPEPADAATPAMS
ncbi:MAG TPA: hypothetical protein VJT67_05315 [Longimicrobiaceae bacterium]|nr:hypothetical protein [Longimicrobiaceae bacterium]